MKIKRRDEIEALISKPAAAIQVVLFFGPDTGLVHERAEHLARTILGTPPDPFGLVEVTEADVRALPSRLFDEWAGISFGGGRKLIRVRNAGEWLFKPLSDILDDKNEGALVLMEAGDIPPRSKLRGLVESEQRGVAAGCYSDSSEDLARLARDMLKAENLTISADVLDELTSRLGSDRQLSRREIEKLILYMGPSAGSPRAVELGDIEAIVGDADALAVDDVVDAALSGEAVLLERALSRAFASGQTPVGIMLATSRAMMRLHFIGAQAQGGLSLDQVIKTLRPPVHFSREANLRRQCKLWPAPKAADWLSRLSEADAMLRAPGAHPPDAALCSRTLYALASAARR